MDLHIVFKEVLSDELKQTLPNGEDLSCDVTM